MVINLELVVRKSHNMSTNHGRKFRRIPIEKSNHPSNSKMNDTKFKIFVFRFVNL